MTDFKTKMHQIRFRLGLSAPPDPLAGFGGHFASFATGGRAGLGKRRGRGGRGSGGEGKGGPQVTVVPGPPSEPCYATVPQVSAMLKADLRDSNTIDIVQSLDFADLLSQLPIRKARKIPLSTL